MTEAEWLSSTNPAAMLRSLIRRYSAQKRRGESPDFEKLRKFACACLRRIWPLLDDDHRRSVQMIEDFVRSPKPGALLAARRVRREAGNQANKEFYRLTRAIPRDRRVCLRSWARLVASSAVWQAADKNPAKAANCHCEVAQAVHSVRLADGATVSGPDPGFIGYELPAGGEMVAQAAILREVVGNPFVSNASPEM